MSKFDIFFSDNFWTRSYRQGQFFHIYQARADFRDEPPTQEQQQEVAQKVSQLIMAIKNDFVRFVGHCLRSAPIPKNLAKPFLFLYNLESFFHCRKSINNVHIKSHTKLCLIKIAQVFDKTLQTQNEISFISPEEKLRLASLFGPRALLEILDNDAWAAQYDLLWQDLVKFDALKIGQEVRMDVGCAEDLQNFIGEQGRELHSIELLCTWENDADFNDTLEQIRDACPELQRLILERPNLSQELLIELAQGCKQLQELEIYYWHGDTIGGPFAFDLAIDQVLRNCLDLRVLHIRGLYSLHISDSVRQAFGRYPKVKISINELIVQSAPSPRTASIDPPLLPPAYSTIPTSPQLLPSSPSEEAEKREALTMSELEHLLPNLDDQIYILKLRIEDLKKSAIKRRISIRLTSEKTVIPSEQASPDLLTPLDRLYRSYLEKQSQIKKLQEILGQLETILR